MSYEKLFDLTHKVALVAGAAGGLARETCLGLSQFGATLALADVDAKGLTRVCNELGRKGIKTWSKVVDVSDESLCREPHQCFETKFWAT